MMNRFGDVPHVHQKDREIIATNVFLIKKEISICGSAERYGRMTEENKKKTICGCTGGSIFGGNNPCFNCGHPNTSHNFGKGCRVSSRKYIDGTKQYYLEDKDVDYTKFKRLMK